MVGLGSKRNENDLDSSRMPAIAFKKIQVFELVQDKSML